MSQTKKEESSRYMSAVIRQSINKAILSEMSNLPNTLAEIKDPVQRLNFLTKLMPFVCAPIKQVGFITARHEVGEDSPLL